MTRAIEYDAAANWMRDARTAKANGESADEIALCVRRARYFARKARTFPVEG